MQTSAKQAMTILGMVNPCQAIHTGVAPSVEAHHRVSGPNTGRNFEGRRIIIKIYKK